MLVTLIIFDDQESIAVETTAIEVTVSRVDAYCLEVLALQLNVGVYLVRRYY